MEEIDRNVKLTGRWAVWGIIEERAFIFTEFSNSAVG
jgi:hypothetical protein